MAKIDLETKLGGLFGCTAMIAIVSEMYLSGFSTQGLVAGLKDASGTMVALMVFLVAIRSMIKDSPKNLHQELEQQFKQFGADYFPLIFKVEGYKIRKEGYYTQGFCILKDVSSFPSLVNTLMQGADVSQYAAYRSQKTTQFIQLPALQSMIKEGEDASSFYIEINFKDNVEYVDGLQEKIAMGIGSRFSYSVDTKKDTLKVTVPCLEERESIQELFSMLGFVVRLFQIGNLGPK